MKKFRNLLAIVLSAVMMFSLVGCTTPEGEFTLNAWEAPTYTEVTRGSEVTVKELSVKDSAGTSYAATATVSDPDSYEVTVTGGKFTASVKGEYKIKYTVTFNGASASKTSTLNVVDSTDDVKTEAKAALDEAAAAKTDADYSAAKLEQIAGFVTEGKEAIDAATSAADIETAKTTALGKINGVAVSVPSIGAMENQDNPGMYVITPVEGVAGSYTVEHSAEVLNYKSVKVPVNDYVTKYTAFYFTITNNGTQPTNVKVRLINSTANGNGSTNAGILNEKSSWGTTFDVPADGEPCTFSILRENDGNINIIDRVNFLINSDTSTTGTFASTGNLVFSDMHFEAPAGAYIGSVAVVGGSGSVFKILGNTVNYDFAAGFAESQYKSIAWNISNFAQYKDATGVASFKITNNSNYDITFKFKSVTDAGSSDGFGASGKTVFASGAEATLQEWVWGNKSDATDVTKIELFIFPAVVPSAAISGSFKIEMEFVSGTPTDSAQLKKWSAPSYSASPTSAVINVTPLSVDDTLDASHTAVVTLKSKPVSSTAAISSGSFTADLVGNYVLAYTVTYGGKAIEKTTTVVISVSAGTAYIDAAKGAIDTAAATKLSGTEGVDYSTAQKEAVQLLATNGKNAIDALGLTTEAQVDSVKNDYIGQINAVQLGVAAPEIGAMTNSDDTFEGFDITAISGGYNIEYIVPNQGYKSVEYTVTNHNSYYNQLEFTVRNYSPTEVVKLRIDIIANSTIVSNQYNTDYTIAANCKVTPKLRWTTAGTVTKVKIMIDSFEGAAGDDNSGNIDITNVKMSNNDGTTKVGALSTGSQYIDVDAETNLVTFDYDTSGATYQSIYWDISNWNGKLNGKTDYGKSNFKLTITNNDDEALKLNVKVVTDYYEWDDANSKFKDNATYNYAQISVAANASSQVEKNYIWGSFGDAKIMDILRLELFVENSAAGGTRTSGSFTITLEIVSN